MRGPHPAKPGQARPRPSGTAPVVRLYAAQVVQFSAALDNDALIDIDEFNQRLVGHGALTQDAVRKTMDDLVADTNSRRASLLVTGLRVSRNANHLVQWLHNAGQSEIRAYRGWRSDQLGPMGMQNASVNDTIVVSDLNSLSWSFDIEVARKYGTDGLVTTRLSPVDDIILTDRLNNPGVRMEDLDDEVLFSPKPYETTVLRTS